MSLIDVIITQQQLL